MQIINDYNDINVDKVKKGDKFLAIHEDESYYSYEFEEKDDILYKFKTILPNNLRTSKSKESYELEHFFKFENNLFLIGWSKFKCRDWFVDDPQFFQSESNLCGKLSGNLISKKFLSFLINENVFTNNYKTKTNNKKILEFDTYDNSIKIHYLYSYLAINVDNNILLFITKFNLDNNYICSFYSIINIDEYNQFIKQIKESDELLSTLIKKQKLNIEFASLKLKDIDIYNVKYINLFLDMIKKVNDINVKKFCDLNILLYKINKAYMNFDNMPFIINKLRKRYNINIENPIKLVYSFYGYNCYDVNGYCRIYDTRTKTLINMDFSNYSDISCKYLKKDNIIITSLKQYYDYYERDKYTELPALFKDINIKLSNVLYKDQNFFISKDRKVFKKFGPFYTRVEVNDNDYQLVFDRYKIYEKLKEAY